MLLLLTARPGVLNGVADSHACSRYRTGSRTVLVPMSPYTKGRNREHYPSFTLAAILDANAAACPA